MSKIFVQDEASRSLSFQNLRTTFLTPEEAITIPALSSQWTWINQGSATIADNYNKRRVTIPALAGNNLRAIVVIPSSVPSQWTMTGAISFCCPATTGPEFGVCLFNNAGTNPNKTFSITFDGLGFPWSINVDRRANLTAAPTNEHFLICWQTYPRVWFRIQQTATERIYSYGGNGLDFYEVGRNALPDYISPTKFGFFGNANQAIYPVYFEVESFSLV